MKRLLALSLLLASPAISEGPLFSHKDRAISQEFENVYQDLKSANSRRGISDGSSANTGEIGEFVSSVTANPTNYPTSDQWGDLVSINLTAGEWIITGLLNSMANGATMSDDNNLGISATSGNSATGLTYGDNTVGIGNPTATTSASGSIPLFRVSLTATTTYYLKYRAKYTVATPKASGRISAFRSSRK